jgi:hypothetical protein
MKNSISASFAKYDAPALKAATAGVRQRDRIEDAALME